MTFWIASTATPGKMIFLAIIMDARTDETVTALRLVNRYLGYFLGIFAFGLGFLGIGFDRRKKRSARQACQCRGRPETEGAWPKSRASVQQIALTPLALD